MIMSDRCTQDCGFPEGHPVTSENEMRAMMRHLYHSGWGYHVIADFSGRSHAELRELLIFGFPVV
jgi:hypothetical protein